MRKIKESIQKLNSFDYVYLDNKRMKQIVLNPSDEIEIILEDKKIIVFSISEILKIINYRNLIIFKREKGFIIFKITKINDNQL